jgi:DNA-binding GntR family transcriptional regulator
MLCCMQLGESSGSTASLTDRRHGTGVAYAAEAIRQLIAAGVVSPGQQLRQEQLANELGVSRAPIREALQSLLAEGVVEHSPNAGYSVIRFSADALKQIYRMRTLLETDLYAAAVPIGPGIAEELTGLNERMAQSAKAGDRLTLMDLNREFHFRIFSCSHLVEIEREVARLWNMSQPYRAIYIYDQAATRRVLDEHRRMITALSNGDNSDVVRIANRHRSGTERQIDTMLVRTRSLEPVSTASE